VDRENESKEDEHDQINIEEEDTMEDSVDKSLEGGLKEGKGRRHTTEVPLDLDV